MTARTTAIGTWNYTRDKNGNLTKLETPAGSATGTAGDGIVSHGYDRMGRQTSTDYSDSTPDVSRTYDLAGRPATMSDGSGTVTYTHDNADRLTDIARTGGGAGLNGTLSYGYDDASNITSRTLPDSTSSTQTFDDDGRLAGVSSGGLTTSLGYDVAGNLTTTTLPAGNGHVETRTYDRAGRLTTVENTKSPTILSKFFWTLDAAGNPTKVKTTRGSTDVYDIYEFDTRNRLTNACYDVGASATSCSGASNVLTYAYDKVSNRTQEIRAGSVGNTGTIDYTYNTADQLTQSSKSGVNTTYTYDTNGNQATAGNRSYTYNLANRLVSTTAASVTTTYSYDGDGRRLSTGGGGTELRYTWDPLAQSGIPELALERDSSGNLVRRYLNGSNGALNYTTSSATYWYHHDPLATVTDVTDASGAAQWKYEYEPYGSARTTTNVSGNAPLNVLRFNHQYLDAETSLYHLRARQYDVSIGRFLATDPLESGRTKALTGTYAYAEAQPTRLVDPLGLCGWSEPPWKCADEVIIKIEVPGFDIPHLRDFSNVVAGFGDDRTFGLTRSLRQAIGGDDAVDYDSRCYGIGTRGSQAADLAFGVVGGVRGGVRMAAKGRARAGARGADEPRNFDHARQEAFDKAFGPGKWDENPEIKPTKWDKETGTAVEFSGPQGAKVGYDRPHPGRDAPFHDVPHISWQSAGKRGKGGQRGNIPYSGPQHPARPRPSDD
jgi:RHS repeat-associated protein